MSFSLPDWIWPLPGANIGDICANKTCTDIYTLKKIHCPFWSHAKNEGTFFSSLVTERVLRQWKEFWELCQNIFGSLKRHRSWRLQDCTFQKYKFPLKALSKSIFQVFDFFRRQKDWMETQRRVEERKRLETILLMKIFIRNLDLEWNSWSGKALSENFTSWSGKQIQCQISVLDHYIHRKKPFHRVLSCVL